MLREGVGTRIQQGSKGGERNQPGRGVGGVETSRGSGFRGFSSFGTAGSEHGPEEAGNVRPGCGGCPGPGDAKGTSEVGDQEFKVGPGGLVLLSSSRAQRPVSRGSGRGLGLVKNCPLLPLRPRPPLPAGLEVRSSRALGEGGLPLPNRSPSLGGPRPSVPPGHGEARPCRRPRTHVAALAGARFARSQTPKSRTGCWTRRGKLPKLVQIVFTQIQTKNTISHTCSPLRAAPPRAPASASSHGLPGFPSEPAAHPGRPSVPRCGPWPGQAAGWSRWPRSARSRDHIAPPAPLNLVFSFVSYSEDRFPDRAPRTPRAPRNQPLWSRGCYFVILSMVSCSVS